MDRIRKIINIIIALVIAIFGVWIVISYIDVMWYQMSGGTSHCWNMFNIVIDLGNRR